MIRELYHGHSVRAQRFRTALLVFDTLAIAFIITTSFMPRATWIEEVDVVLGILFALDLVARVSTARNKRRELTRPSTWADIIATGSMLLAPLIGDAGGFLRVLRTLRLVKAYSAIARQRHGNDFFRLYEDTINAATNLIVFIFISTAIVYETQHRTSPEITNYADALYFTVTALTTTGFGDITFETTSGRLIAVVIMLAGVTLFLRLAQVMFRPTKVRFDCPVCRLQRHDPDAVHCKACGTVLAIPDDDADN